jgi:hypothetical protein
MADICIIYAREDRKAVASLDRILSGLGWQVWWDEHLTGRGFPSAIQQELRDAACVLVVWSHHSVDKEWVLDEARFVKETGRPLIQIKIEKVVVPVGFGQDEVLDLIAWPETPSHIGFQRLLKRVNQSTGGPKNVWDGKRKLSLAVGGKSLALPTFFRSVSSYEAPLQPYAAIQALELLKTEAVLVSAYDLTHAKHRARIIASLRRQRSNGSIVLLDSGNYEAYRKDDGLWRKALFRKTLSLNCFDYAFCFDNLKPPPSVKANIRDVVSRVIEDQERSRSGKILPIVHIPIKKGHSNTAIAPDLLAGIAEAIRPDLIAVPERELGSGVIERARVVHEIRGRLDSLGWYQPLHLLGTGNPLSLAIFAAAGADTFDGLEWCRTATDHETALLYHFQQYDFFQHQTRSAESPVVRAAADADGVSYNAKVAFHNLEFFQVWIGDIRKDIAHGRIDRLLRDFLPKGFFKDLAKALPGVFEP